MSCLYETAAFMVASRDTVQSLLRAGLAVAGDRERASFVLSLLSMLSKYCPQSFEGFEADIVNWLCVAVESDSGSRKGISYYGFQPVLSSQPSCYCSEEA